MSDSLQTLAFFAFMAMWFGGMVVMWLRHDQASSDYLHHFRSDEGYRLDAYSPSRGGPLAREMRQLFQEPQDDPELERLRYVAWRRFGYLWLWGFGFPLLVFGVAVILILC